MFTTQREESGTVLQIPNNLFFQKMFRVSGHAAVSTLRLRKHADSTPLAPGAKSAERR
jgi:hypothetical protein